MKFRDIYQGSFIKTEFHDRVKLKISDDRFLVLHTDWDVQFACMCRPVDADCHLDPLTKSIEFKRSWFEEYPVDVNEMVKWPIGTFFIRVCMGGNYIGVKIEDPNSYRNTAPNTMCYFGLAHDTELWKCRESSAIAGGKFYKLVPEKAPRLDTLLED